MDATILVVEDEILMSRLLVQLLESEGFTVTAVDTAAAAVDEVRRSKYDLMLLDVVLPDYDGLWCCREIRRTQHMPIIMISRRSALEDRCAALNTGADDYIVKPFNRAEVLARVRSQLRRSRDLLRPSERISLGHVVVDRDVRDAVVGGKGVGLTPREFNLLHTMAAQAGRPLSRDYLVSQVWGHDELASDRELAVYIRRLRKKIEKDAGEPQVVLTVRGFGYKVVPTS